MEPLQIPSKIFSQSELVKEEKLLQYTSRGGYNYQPLKLIKQMGKRHVGEKTSEALDRAHGLTHISPDNDINPSFLKDFIDQKIKCEFLIVVAMYNESSEHFTNTITGITDNLDIFEAAGIDPGEIACIVIVDGMKAFLDTYKKQPQFFSQFFDENEVKDRFCVENLMDCTFNEKLESDEFAHCFMHEIIFGRSQIPLKLIFCVKQYNKRKLNTHLWFFGGFCEMIKPKFVMLLDVGTKPEPRSLFYLYEAMECNEQLAGCCGEIKPMNYNIWKFPVCAQFVEYKFAHMLDKALESVIGYITVLPGAFSAYRWEALDGDPLWVDYFKSICHPELMDAFQSNIYLAEDRVLCLSLVTKKYNNYTLRYVRKSVAETDVPESISDLMAQRRRWINGSWFALVDSLKNFFKVFNSRHHWVRKVFFMLQMIYYFLNVIYTWFIVGLFCLAFSVTIFKFFENTKYSYLGSFLIIIYVTLLFMVFIASLGVKPKRVEDFFKMLSMLMGAYQIFIIFLTSRFMMQMDYSHFKIVMTSVGGTAGFFAFIVIINCQVVTIIKGAFHYVFLIPTYVNIFFIYSISNVHDCTWGNRPDSLTAEEKERIEEFEEFRTRWAILWALCNSGIAYAIYWIYTSKNDQSFYIISGITLTGISIIILRGVGGIIYLFVENCQKKMNIDETKIEERDKNRKTSKVIPNSGKKETSSVYNNASTVINIENRANIEEEKVAEVEKNENDEEEEKRKKKEKRKLEKKEKRSKRREEKKKKREEKKNSKEERKSKRHEKSGEEKSEFLPQLTDDRSNIKHDFLDEISKNIMNEKKKDL